jgi:hypothetical protein
VCPPVLIKFRCNPRTASFIHFTLSARGQECSPAARQRGHCHSIQPPASLGYHLAVTCNTDARVRPPTCPPIRPPIPPQTPPPVCKTLSVAPAAHQETGSTGYTKSTAWETVRFDCTIPVLLTLMRTMRQLATPAQQRVDETPRESSLRSQAKQPESETRSFNHHDKYPPLSA